MVVQQEITVKVVLSIKGQIGCSTLELKVPSGSTRSQLTQQINDTLKPINATVGHIYSIVQVD